VEALQLRRRHVAFIAGVVALATASVVAAGAAGGHDAVTSQPTFHCTAGSRTPGGSDRGSGPLLPGKPTALLLCRYGPLPSHTLQGSRLLRSRLRVRKLARGLNALPVMPSGATSCPHDDGSTVVVLATYRKGAPRVVQVERSGCLTARRGGVVRWDLPDHGRFVHRLERLAR
jgi:hypothetical protein